MCEPHPNLTGPIFSLELSRAVDELFTADASDAQAFADATAARLQLRLLAEHLDEFIMRVVIGDPDDDEEQTPCQTAISCSR